LTAVIVKAGLEGLGLLLQCVHLLGISAGNRDRESMFRFRDPERKPAFSTVF